MSMLSRTMSVLSRSVSTPDTVSEVRPTNDALEYQYLAPASEPQQDALAVEQDRPAREKDPSAREEDPSITAMNPPSRQKPPREHPGKRARRELEAQHYKTLFLSGLQHLR